VLFPTLCICVTCVSKGRPGHRDTRDRANASSSAAPPDGRAADPSLIEVYVDTAYQAIDYLEAHTGYRSEQHYPVHAPRAAA
jgi:hypothetical protein